MIWTRRTLFLTLGIFASDCPQRCVDGRGDWVPHETRVPGLPRRRGRLPPRAGATEGGGWAPPWNVTPRALTPPPPHWSMAVQQMFCDIDTVPDKRRICRIYSVIWTLFLHSMMTCDVELCLLCNSLWTLLLLTLFITVLCIDIFVSALENVRRE